MKSRSTSAWYRAKGYKPFAVMLPGGVWQAVRDRLYRDGVTAQTAMIKLLTIWSGYKPDDTTDKPESPSS